MAVFFGVGWALGVLRAADVLGVCRSSKDALRVFGRRDRVTADPVSCSALRGAAFGVTSGCSGCGCVTLTAWACVVRDGSVSSWDRAVDISNVGVGSVS